ncbi:hypothetical protein HK104_010758 [Borealophlyctis nickersoniae]|nr:hypothetical protein HK104_010758 [Borealophlyctis nickersoniae]
MHPLRRRADRSGILRGTTENADRTAFTFFALDKLYTFNIPANKTTKPQPPLAKDAWGLLPTGWTSDFDAALTWNDGKNYVFKGTEYIRHDRGTNKVDDVPITIDDGWDGVLTKMKAPSIDVAVNWRINNKTYFFYDDIFARYDNARETLDPNYPQPIAGNFATLSQLGRLDAALYLNNTHAYFFAGSKYVLFNPFTNKIPAGYPREIQGAWPGLLLEETTTPSNATTTASTTSNSPTTAATTDSSGVPMGVMAGAAVGGVIAGLLVLGLAMFVKKRRQRTTRKGGIEVPEVHMQRGIVLETRATMNETSEVPEVHMQRGVALETRATMNESPK